MFRVSFLKNVSSRINKVPSYLFTVLHVVPNWTSSPSSSLHTIGWSGQDAVRRLKPVNPVSLSVSSRTDSGVHALSNSAHLDLQRSGDKPPFADDVLFEALNFHLLPEEIRWVAAEASYPDPSSLTSFFPFLMHYTWDKHRWSETAAL